ncbi:MAG: TA system VapC family ribonuclease toxin [Betaproteobacteria bacterium]
MTEPSSSWRVAEASANWRVARGDLPDVNVWVALCSAAHPFHASAMQYWQSSCQSGTTLWFCRATMMGLVRLLSQPRVMGSNVLDLAQAIALYRQWLATPAVELWIEAPGVDEALEQIMARRAQAWPARLWTDICLAATAQAAGLRLASFDRDFDRYGLERCLVLPASSPGAA